VDLKEVGSKYGPQFNESQVQRVNREDYMVVVCFLVCLLIRALHTSPTPGAVVHVRDSNTWDIWNNSVTKLKGNPLSHDCRCLGIDVITDIDCEDEYK